MHIIVTTMLIVAYEDVNGREGTGGLQESLLSFA